MAVVQQGQPTDRWERFQKRSIGKSMGLMVPYDAKVVVMIRAARCFYMSKRVLRELGNPTHIAIERDLEKKVRPIFAIVAATAEDGGYKIHGLDGGTSQSAYADLTAWIRENHVNMGLYECDVEKDNGVVHVLFSLDNYTPITEKRNGHR